VVACNSVAEIDSSMVEAEESNKVEQDERNIAAWVLLQSCTASLNWCYERKM
jgi:hypothetical protein